MSDQSDAPSTGESAVIDRGWSGTATLTPWPFPEDPRGPKDPNTFESWDVYDDAGKYLSSITTWPVSDMHIDLVGEAQSLRVIGVYPALGRVVVERMSGPRTYYKPHEFL